MAGMEETRPANRIRNFMIAESLGLVRELMSNQMEVKYLKLVFSARISFNLYNPVFSAFIIPITSAG
jgi:hypothetical protein